MHEYSVVQSLVDSVMAAARGHERAVVRRVEVRIGEVSGVDCTLLATAYEVFRQGTICEHAPMVIERIPPRWECSRCGAEIAGGGFLRCGPCGAPARLAAGDEIVLQRIELEVA